MSEAKPNIYQRINAIMAALGAMDKDSKAPGVVGGYMYVSYDALMARVQPLLVKNGVVLQFEEREYSRWDTVNKEGKPTGGITNILVAVTWINMDDPQDRTTDIVRGQGHDSTDKGPGKALTYCVKQAVLKRTCAPCGEDIEATESEPVAQAQAPPATAGPAQPAPMTAPAMASDIVRMLGEMEMDTGDLTDWLTATYESTFNDMQPDKQDRAHTHIAEMHKAYCVLVPPGVKALGPVRETGVNPLTSDSLAWEAYLRETVEGMTKEATT